MAHRPAAQRGRAALHHHARQHVEVVDHLAQCLAVRGVAALPFDLLSADTGLIAEELVDAATLVIGTPTTLGGPHPLVGYALSLANLLKPKAKFAAFLISYGWGAGAVERLPGLIEGLRVKTTAGGGGAGHAASSRNGRPWMRWPDHRRET